MRADIWAGQMSRVKADIGERLKNQNAGDEMAELPGCCSIDILAVEP